jgi:TRAP transporter TAXI family solute receptor
MLRALRRLTILALLASPVSAQQADAPAAPEPVLVSMGTAAVTGVYFPVGVSLCRLVNQHRRETGVRCAARPTEGSVANIAGLREGRLELAIVQSDVQAQAVAGTGAFADAGPLGRCGR